MKNENQPDGNVKAPPAPVTGDDPIGDFQAEARQAKLDEFVQVGKVTGGTAEASDARDAQEAVAREIFCVIRPDNMIEADWDSGAILGGGNVLRNKCVEAAIRAIKAMAGAKS